MNCWKCSKSLEETLKISFRAVCKHCDIDLHVCVNCKYHSPGKPNDCIVPGTDRVHDKERSNFCEEFKPLHKLNIVENKQKFNELFK